MDCLCIEMTFGRAEDQNIACRCDSVNCDTGLAFDWPTDGRQFLRVTSSKSGARFQVDTLQASDRSAYIAQREPSASGSSESNGDNNSKDIDYTVGVQLNLRHQQVTGFGGAITDSAAQNIWNLKASVRARLLDDYFGPHGLEYNMARIPIAGTDMSSRAYSYDDTDATTASNPRDMIRHEEKSVERTRRELKAEEEEQQQPIQVSSHKSTSGASIDKSKDFSLSRFRLQPEDLLLKIPLIKRVNEMRASRGLEPLKLLASCWSAPAWMKDNHNLVQGSLLGASDTPAHIARNPYYRAYAQYIVRFLEAYETFNISLWALSAQNEPRSPSRVGPKVIHHNTVNFTPDQLTAFYKFHLLPQLFSANFTSDKLRQFIWEDTLDDISMYLDSLLAEPLIRDNIMGVALHWYSQGLHEIPYSRLLQIHRSVPFRYSLLSTEASFLGGQKPGVWSRGERYMRDIIETLRSGFIGWLDWNLALDKLGGPTWAQNPLDSAVQVDVDTQSYIKNPTYYALGHITRFIKPKSNIVHSSIWTERSRLKQLAANFSTQELYAIAAELEPVSLSSVQAEPEAEPETALPKPVGGARKVGLVLMNRADEQRTVRLELADCPAKQAHSDLVFELQARSFVSLAFIC